MKKTQEVIKKDIKTSFMQASDIAVQQFNNKTIIIGGYLAVDQGYLVYEFVAINPANQTAYKTIVDAGNGAVIYTSEGIQINNLFDHPWNADREKGLAGFLGGHDGHCFGHGALGFGPWKGLSGFNGQHDSNINAAWPWL
jgi:hypothetical protein